MKNPVIPLNKSIYTTVGAIMVVSAFLFAVSGEFKLEVGHMGLAAVGCMAIILGVFVSEANLAIFSGGLIFVNIFAAIVWFFFK